MICSSSGFKILRRSSRRVFLMTVSKALVMSIRRIKALQSAEVTAFSANSLRVKTCSVVDLPCW